MQKPLTDAVKLINDEITKLITVRTAIEHLGSFGTGTQSTKRKHLSPTARRRIAKAQKARWAKFRNGKTNVVSMKKKAA
jgi:hypothetical protein